MTFFNTVLKSNWFTGVLGIVVVALTFYKSTSGEFLHYDDTLFIHKQLDYFQLNFQNIKYWFSHSAHGHYHPLTWLLYMLQYNLFGLEPWGYHLFSIVGHILAGLCLFYLLKQLDIPLIHAHLVTALFWLMPIQCEAVSWIAAQSTLWYALAFFMSLTQFMLFSKRRGWYNLVLAHVFFLAALLFKFTSIALPLVWLVYFISHRKGNLFPMVLWLLPSFLLSILFAAKALGSVVAFGNIDFSASVELGQWFINNVKAIIWYISIGVLNFDLTIIYPYSSLWGSYSLLSMAMVLLAMVLFFFQSNTKRAFFIMGLCTLVVYLPIFKVGSTFMAERYLYCALPFLLLFYIDSLEKFLKFNLSLFMGFLIVVVFLATYHRQSIWNNNQHFFNEIIAHHPNQAFGYYGMGTYYLDKGWYDFSEDQLKTAVRLDTNLHQGYNHLGMVYMAKNQIFQAIDQFNKALSKSPTNRQYILNRALAYRKNQQFIQSSQDYWTLIEKNAKDSEAIFGLANVYFYAENWVEAKKMYDTLLQMDSGDERALKNRGLCYLKLEDLGLACKDFRSLQNQALFNKFCKNPLPIIHE